MIVNNYKTNSWKSGSWLGTGT